MNGNMRAEINEPCPESWDRMKIGINSRYCDNCEKSVQDFTDRSRQQILEYLLLNQDKRTCGRMRKSQVDFSNEEILFTVDRLSKKSTNPNFAFYLLALSATLIVSCSNPSDNNTTTYDSIAENPIVEQFDSTELNTVSIDSNSIIKDTSLNAPPPPPPPAPIIGEMIMGDVEWIDTEIDIPVDPKDTEQEHNQEDMDSVFTFVEIMPEFPGGMDSLKLFMQDSLNYPKLDQELGIQGTVVVKFIVELDGAISNPEIVRSISKSTDKESIRIMELMPNWKPGSQRGKIRRVQMHLPIRYKLD